MTTPPFVLVPRDRRPPHRALANGVAPAEPLPRYGFQLGGFTPIQAHVSRETVDGEEVFVEGNMVSIERPNEVAGLQTWVGFIVETDGTLGGGTVRLDLLDFAGYLWGEDSSVATAWPRQDGASADIIRSIFTEGMEPPEHGAPIVALPGPDTFGPYVEYPPAGETVLDFLQTMVEAADWEWDVVFDDVGPDGLQPRLVWAERIGGQRDLSQVGGPGIEIIDGVHFIRAGFSRSVRGGGNLKSSIAVGGSGTFRERPAAIASAGGASRDGLTGVATDETTEDAPGGSRLIVNPQIENADALERAALRIHHAPEYIGEGLTVTLREGANADGLTPFPLEALVLGAQYRFRATDARWSSEGAVDRTIRLIGYDFGGDGHINCNIQVVG